MDATKPYCKFTIQCQFNSSTMPFERQGVQRGVLTMEAPTSPERLERVLRGLPVRSVGVDSFDLNTYPIGGKCNAVVVNNTTSQKITLCISV
jgi:hypothetical protein